MGERSGEGKATTKGDAQQTARKLRRFILGLLFFGRRISKKLARQRPPTKEGPVERARRLHESKELHPTTTPLFMADLDNIQNLGGSFDPLADAEKEEEGSAPKDIVHIRMQQRNGRKCLTTIQGINPKIDLKKVIKVFKKELHATARSSKTPSSARSFSCRETREIALPSSSPSKASAPRTPLRCTVDDGGKEQQRRRPVRRVRRFQGIAPRGHVSATTATENLHYVTFVKSKRTLELRLGLLNL